MAHTIVWRDELDTGIDVIDQQHRRIVAMINRLAEGTPERLDEVFSELVDYT